MREEWDIANARLGGENRTRRGEACNLTRLNDLTGKFGDLAFLFGFLPVVDSEPLIPALSIRLCLGRFSLYARRWRLGVSFKVRMSRNRWLG